VRLCSTFHPVQTLPAIVLCLAALVMSPLAARADDKAPADALPELKTIPTNVEDLKAIQSQVKKVLAKAIPATVGIRIGNSAGSGVIIDKEGHVLTAAHVSGRPDIEVTLILQDGKTVKGKTLGLNRNRDSGLIKITEKGDWQFAEMGKASDLKRGSWCIAVGHPNGYKPGRPPVVRLGRLQGISNNPEVREDFLQTDCALVGGDSGGPLFDLEGKVIGIHSSIGGRMSQNQHVPIDTFRDTWERLAQGEAWGGRTRSQAVANGPWMGVEADRDAEKCVIKGVIKDSPAEKAGLKVDDLILKFDGKSIKTFEELFPLIGKRKVGDKVSVEVQRGKEVVKVELVLGKRQS
jgi:serine protease Do